MKNNKKCIVIYLMIILLMIVTPIRYVNATNDTLTVKSAYTDNVKIVGNDIYARLDSSSTDAETINATKLTDTLNVDTGYTLEIDSTNNTNKKVYTGTKLNIKDSSSTTISQYNIYLMGDICKDSSNVININDVAYLRRAIVGYDMTEKTDYEQKTTDVNWSNGTSEEPGLGDIGDVIAIRRRILNYKWDNTVPVVTNPPTTPVTEKTKFQDEDDNVAVIPPGFKVSSEESEQNIDSGLVVIAPDGNEFVWVPVFEYDENNCTWGVDYSAVNSKIEGTDEYYTMIKTALKSYTDRYSDGSYSDAWYGDSNYGKYGYYDGSEFVYYTNGNMDEPTYNKLYREMLISVYKNGGFYIGRYEMGTAVVNSTTEAENNTRTQVSEYTPSTATSGTTTNIEAVVKIGDKPVIKANAVPYNYITQSQAQMLAESLNYSSVKSSLMFGVQWDMVCVFLEHYGKVDSSAISKAGTSFTVYYLIQKEYSRYWGNHRSSSFNMNRGFYNTYNSGFHGWTAGAAIPDTGSGELCTTGASDQNRALNIYDFGGNEMEFTLERCSDSSKSPCVSRGGYFNGSYSTSWRDWGDTYAASYISSARPSLYIK